MARLDSLKIFWYRRIVNFDNDSQTELVSTTKQFFQAKWQSVQDWTDTKITTVRDWLKQPWDVSRLLAVTATVLGLIGVTWWWQKIGRRWWLALRRKSNRRSDQDPVRREASRWLRRGAKRDAFHWPEDVRSELLRLRFGNADSWQDPDRVFQAAKATWRST